MQFSEPSRKPSAKPAFFEPSGWRWDPSAENREAIFSKKEAWFKKYLAERSYQ